MPGVAVLVSPWVDLEHSGESWTTRQKRDPMLDCPLVDLVSGHYLNGKSASDPIVTSIKADLRGLPPMLIQVSEREVLFSDAERLAARAKEAGVEATWWPSAPVTTSRSRPTRLAAARSTPTAAR